MDSPTTKPAAVDESPSQTPQSFQHILSNKRTVAPLTAEKFLILKNPFTTITIQTYVPTPVSSIPDITKVFNIIKPKIQI